MSGRWESRLQELKEFKEENGHCNVPQKHPGGLGYWVRHQRRITGEGGGRRNASQTQELEELGFQWIPPTKPDKWEARLQELKEYKEEHGHCNVPSKHPGGLGDWARDQRRAGKEGTGRLNPVRTQALEELGFRWGKAKRSDRWEQRIQELKEFKKKNGHCNVPKKHPGGLGIWVNNTRRAGKEGSRRLDACKAQQPEELDSTKPSSSMKQGGTEQEQELTKLSLAARWETRLRDLKEFREENGHCNVPRTHPGALGIWVKTQRKFGKEGYRRLFAGRAQKLEELGFQWTTPSASASNRWVLQWESRLRELKEFKEKHGHCNVHNLYPGGLGCWARKQRYAGKEGSQRLDAGQIQKLEELGFQWRIITKSARWEERLQELKNFKEKHGHCDVPSAHPGGLGGWVRDQRRTGHEGGRRLGDDQIQELEELGFQWGMTTQSDRWEARLQELREFKEEHGHCNVTKNHPGGLGFWVEKQRSRELDTVRIQKLEELGFQWRLRELKESKEKHGHCNANSNNRAGKEESERLGDDQIQDLEDLGFQWEVTTQSDQREARWEARLQELKEFKEEHGHCNVTKNHPGGLGRWVQTQRYAGKEGSRECDAVRIQKLEELGFQWPSDDGYDLSKASVGVRAATASEYDADPAGYFSRLSGYNIG